MDTEVKYPKWFIEFAQDMLDMRDAQREYFKQKNNHRLTKAKIKESRADQWIERMVKADLIKSKPKETNNLPNLF